MSENNLPAEVQAITAMERNREKLTDVFKGQQQSLMLSAGDTLRGMSQERQINFMEQFALEVCNDEKLVDCFNSTPGKRSIVEALRKSLETGLKIGGKHAYLIPQKVDGNLTARYSIKAEGYVALLCGGTNPIFKDVKWGRVHEEDDFRIDESEGVISHSHGMNRGKFLGCWVKIIKKNDEVQAFAFDSDKINQWRKSAKTQSVWNAWPEEMAEQACIRHACSRFEEAKDMLAEAWSGDKQNDVEQSDDITDRASQIMPEISDDDIGGITVTPVEDGQKAPKKKPAKKGAKKDDGKKPESEDTEDASIDLF